MNYILFFIGLFFFLDTVLPEKYKETRYKHWYHYIPGSYTFLYLYDVSRGVKWNPDYRPLVQNFKVTKEELKTYIYTRLFEYYLLTGKEKIESAYDIKILTYGTPQGCDEFNIQYKAKLDGKWVIHGYSVKEKQFLEWLWKKK
jgi:hypothetical protein